MEKRGGSQRQAGPRIRIIKVVEPKIVKTDPAHFLHVVQSLTGKPPRRHKPTGSSYKLKRPTAISTRSSTAVQQPPAPAPSPPSSDQYWPSRNYVLASPSRDWHTPPPPDPFHDASLSDSPTRFFLHEPIYPLWHDSLPPVLSLCS